MLRCKYVLVAENVICDAESNQISAIGILEEVQALGYPVFMQKAFFFAYLEKDRGDPDTTDLKIVILSNDIQIGEAQVTVSFQGRSRTRMLARMNGTVIPQPGSLTFRITTVDQSPTTLCEYAIITVLINQPLNVTPMQMHLPPGQVGVASLALGTPGVTTVPAPATPTSVAPNPPAR